MHSKIVQSHHRNDRTWVTHGGLRGRNVVLIVLMSALKLQKIVVTAFVAVGILAAYRRARGVNRATTFVLIKEHAHALVHMVLAMPQDPFIGVLGFVVIRKLFARGGGREVEMLGQAIDVGIRHFDARMTAAITGTG